MDSFDVYVLCQERLEGVAFNFLESFLPCRRPLDEDYPFPEFSDLPQCVYGHPDEVIRRAVREPNATYSLYWESEKPNRFRQAMLYFTEDGAMIAGLVVPADKAEDALVELGLFWGGQFGLITLESPPPETVSAFTDLSRQSILPSLVDGRLRRGDLEASEWQS